MPTTITDPRSDSTHISYASAGGMLWLKRKKVVRVVTPLHLPQPLEVRISVGCAHAFDGLIRSSVVEVAAAARRVLRERGGRAPRPGDVDGVRGRVLPRGGGADVEVALPYG